MEPECSFYGLKLTPGESVEIETDWDEDLVQTVHLTQVALGDKPAKGPHTIFIEREGEQFAIGTLDSEKCPHFSIDITLATDTVTLSHTGKSDVFITGYQTISVYPDYDEDSDDDGYGIPGYASLAGQGASDSEEDEGESDEDESSDEEGGAPAAVPLSNGRLLQVEQSSSSDDDDDEEEMEEDSDEDGSDKHIVGEGASSSEEEDEDEEEEEEEEEENTSTSDESEEDELPAKRAASMAKTPQPTKKQKLDLPVAPATAPAKVQGDVKKEYEHSIKAYIQLHGPTKLAILGSAVKRPPSVPKVKAFLQSVAGLKYDQGTDTVSLAK